MGLGHLQNNSYEDCIYVRKHGTLPTYTIIEDDKQKGLRVSRIISETSMILSEIYINKFGGFSSNNALEIFVEDLGY